MKKEQEPSGKKENVLNFINISIQCFYLALLVLFCFYCAANTEQTQNKNYFWKDSVLSHILFIFVFRM